MNELGYILLSVGLVSLLSLAGVLTLAVGVGRMDSLVTVLVSFAAGTLFGNVFLHLLPELAAEHGFDAATGILVLAGLFFAFVIERFVFWHHSHHPDEAHPEPLSYMILLGDGVHNVIDGMIIAASYLASIPLGIATTVAITFHEIPQEIGDYGVLVYGGISRRRAVLYNFLTALTAFVGAFAVIWVVDDVEGLTRILLPVAAGNFIYIAGSDLLPELARDDHVHRSLVQMAVFVLGIGVLYALAL